MESTGGVAVGVQIEGSTFCTDSVLYSFSVTGLSGF